MTKEGKKGVGPTARVKGSGTGAMTDIPDQMLGDRDKASHSEAHGQDSRRIQSDQYQNHAHEKPLDE